MGNFYGMKIIIFSMLILFANLSNAQSIVDTPRIAALIENEGIDSALELILSRCAALNEYSYRQSGPDKPEKIKSQQNHLRSYFTYALFSIYAQKRPYLTGGQVKDEIFGMIKSDIDFYAQTGPTNESWPDYLVDDNLCIHASNMN